MLSRGAGDNHPAVRDIARAAAGFVAGANSVTSVERSMRFVSALVGALCLVLALPSWAQQALVIRPLAERIRARRRGDDFAIQME